MEKNFQKKLLKKGAHLGHKSLKIGFKKTSHSSMYKFLLGIRKNIHIFDLNYTIKYLITALSVIYSVTLSGGTLLVVNTNPEYVNLIQFFFKKLQKKKQISYIDSIWIGGGLTNWKQIAKSLSTYIQFSKKFDFFLSKNNINFPRYKKMKKSFQGMIDNVTSASSMVASRCNLRDERIEDAVESKEKIFLNKKPDLIFIVNPNENSNLLQECKSLNIPVIAITNSNTDISKISYPIPSNNHSFFLLHICLKWILEITTLTVDDDRRFGISSRCPRRLCIASR